MTVPLENASDRRPTATVLGWVIVTVTLGLFALTPLSVPKNAPWPSLFAAPLMPYLLGTIVSASILCAFWITFGSGRFLKRATLSVIFWGLALLTCWAAYLWHNSPIWSLEELVGISYNEFLALANGTGLCTTAAIVATLVRRYWSGWHLAGQTAPQNPKRNRMAVLIVLFLTLAIPFAILSSPRRTNPYVLYTASSLALLVIAGSVGAILVGPGIWRLVGRPQSPQAKWAARLAAGALLAAGGYFAAEVWRESVTDLLVAVSFAAFPTAAAFWWLGRRGVVLRQYDLRQITAAPQRQPQAPAKHPLDD